MPTRRSPSCSTPCAARSSVQLDEAVKRNLLEAIPPESRDVSKIRDQDIENIKRQVTVNKQSDVTIRIRENQVAAVEKLPQANMPSLVSQGFKWDDYAIEADTDDPFFRQLNLTIQVNADFRQPADLQRRRHHRLPTVDGQARRADVHAFKSRTTSASSPPSSRAARRSSSTATS